MHLRRGADGKLSQPSGVDGCVSDDPNGFTPACGPGVNVANARDVAISADGTKVLVTGGKGVTSFVRDPATGGLSFAGCVSGDGQGSSAPGGAKECTDGRVITVAFSVAISPDGRFAYVARIGSANADNAVAILSIADNGTLTQPDGACLRTGGNVPPIEDQGGAPGEGAGCQAQAVPGLGDAYDLAMSTDGSTLFVVNERGVLTLTRDATSGALTPAGCVNADGTNGCVDLRAITSPVSAALSPDGASLYLRTQAGLAHLKVGPGGALTQAADATGCFTTDGDAGDSPAPCGVAKGMRDGIAVAASPDGRSVITGGLFGAATTSTFDVGAGGVLTYAGCVSADGSGDGTAGTCTTAPSIGYGPFVLSPGGEHLYGTFGAGVSFARREVAPTCSDASGTVVAGGTTTLPFGCADLNGDPVSISQLTPPSIGTASLAGTAATYSVGCDKGGTDSFTIAPSDGVNTGPAATGTVTVTPRPCPEATVPPAASRPAPLPKLRGTLKPDKKRRVKLKLTCAATEPAPCAGRLTVKTPKLKVGKKRKKLTVLSTRYTVAPGATKTIKARLSKRVAKAIRKKRSVACAYTLAAPASAGFVAKRKTGKVRLKPAKKRKRARSVVA